MRRLEGGERKPQLVCRLHGTGGSGKSTVINMVKAYARDYCKELNHPFTNRTIVVTAWSGVAATLLNGETTSSVLGLMRGGITEEEKDVFADCRLIIVDEVSFLSPVNFAEMWTNIGLLMRKTFAKYGGTNILFAGDYSQLEPIKCDTVYAGGKRHPEFHDVLNCYIELDGTHRFKDDVQWGEKLRRFRDGEPTIQDVCKINDCCDAANRNIPEGTQIATFTNVMRDAVNSGIFEDFCKANKPEDGSVLKSAVVVLMDELKMQNGNKKMIYVRSNGMRRHFYEHCGENDCREGTKQNPKTRVEPMLKLYPECPMMLTKNTDVPNGEANGSRI